MSITVILVDDHAAFREGLHLLLETQSDIRVVAETADGAEAERLARECHADVVVMDIGMPGLNALRPPNASSRAATARSPPRPSPRG